MSSVDIEGQTGDVDEHEESQRQDHEGQDDGGEEPLDPEHVVKVHILTYPVKGGLEESVLGAEDNRQEARSGRKSASP